MVNAEEALSPGILRSQHNATSKEKKRLNLATIILLIFHTFFLLISDISYPTFESHVAEQPGAWKYYSTAFTVAKSSFFYSSHCYKFCLEHSRNTWKSSGITGYFSQHSPRYAIKPSSRELSFSRFYLHGFRHAWFHLQRIVSFIRLLPFIRVDWTCFSRSRTVRCCCRCLEFICNRRGPFFSYFFSIQVYISDVQTTYSILYLSYLASWGDNNICLHGPKLCIYSISLLHSIDLGDNLSVYLYLCVGVEEGTPNRCFTDCKCEKDHQFFTRAQVDKDDGNYLGRLHSLLGSSSCILRSCFARRSKICRYPKLDQCNILFKCYFKSIYLLHSECKLSYEGEKAG